MAHLAILEDDDDDEVLDRRGAGVRILALAESFHAFSLRFDGRLKEFLER